MGVLVALVVLIALIALAVIVAIRIKQRSKKNGNHYTVIIIACFGLHWDETHTQLQRIL